MSLLDSLDRSTVEKLYKDGVIQNADLHYYLVDAILSRNVELLITISKIALIDLNRYYRAIPHVRGVEILSAVDILAKYPQDIVTTYTLIDHPTIPFSNGQTELEGLIRTGLRLFDPHVRHKCIKGAIDILTTVSGIDLSLVMSPPIRQAVTYLSTECDHPIVTMATKSLLFRHYLHQLYRLDSLIPLPELKVPPSSTREHQPQLLHHDTFLYGVGSFLSVRDLTALSEPLLFPMIEVQYRIRITEVLETIPSYPRVIKRLVRMNLFNSSDLSLLTRIALLSRNIGLIASVNRISPRIVCQEIVQLSQTVPLTSMLSITDMMCAKFSLLKKRKIDLLTPILQHRELSSSHLPLTNSNVSWQETLEYPAITNLEIASRNLALAESVITGTPYITTKLAITNYVRGYIDTPPNDERKVLKYRLTRLRELYRRWGIP
jgi:hypothetical protein